MERKEQKKNIDIYKWSTFILLGLILIFVSIYLVVSYSNYKFNQGVEYGQKQTADFIIQNIISQGYISINYNNQSLTLVPSAMVSSAREQTILEIMNLVEKEGYVTLYNNQTQIVLVEYTQG